MVRALFSIYCRHLPCPWRSSPVAELLRHVCLHIPAPKNKGKKFISKWITANNKTGISYVLIHNSHDCTMQCPSNIGKAWYFRRWPHLFSGDCHYTEWYFLTLFINEFRHTSHCESYIPCLQGNIQILRTSNPLQYWLLDLVYYILL